ncbi:very long chain fatty acid elongase 5-like [Epargyreus clarus]|uniref:very long chain fatty acid elongase 5-like n=1 Tax=Epargyreus clarus TaxID=520877 RepID=UPI003C2F1D3C
MGSLVQSVNGSLWDFKGEIDYVDEWFLMGSPVPLLAIWLAYITFVLKLGPAYMKGRPPFKLRKILIAYNIIQVLISCYLCYAVLSNFYYYFLAKISELLDTIFFVLRKHYRQVSFLHVYHHSLTVLFTWMIIKFDPSDIIIFIGTLNSFVHIVMYGYYALSAFPRLTKYLWWKAYITKLQLIQFMIILVQATITYKYSRCSVTLMLMGFIYFNLVLMIVLFSNFYIRSYLKNNTNAANGIKINGTEKKNITREYINGKHEKKNGAHANGKHNGTESRKENNGISKITNGSQIDYVDEWTLMRSPIPVFAIFLVYISFVLKFGPNYMKSRPPFQLRNILVAYNIIQVVISSYLFYSVISNYYYYLLAKISELLDTVFFILRKRYRQVSFLHVYHHAAVVVSSWIVIKFEPSEVTIFLGTLNSFVHIIMYSYYALSAFPHLTKYLWWKAYITKIQLEQLSQEVSVSII